MKFSKEARIGLLVAISLLVLFAGFYFLKGSDILSNDYEYFTYYDNVQGMQPSAAVQIKGLQVGKVSKIKLDPNGKIRVTLTINRRTRLPVGTVAKMTSLDLLGNKGITLELGNSSELVDDEAVLPAAVEGGIIDKISVEVTPLLQDVRKVINNVDSVLTSVNQIFSYQARVDLQNSVAALHVSMDNFSHLSAKLNGQSEALANVIRNADKVTTTLASNNDNIDNTLKSLRTTSDKLSRAPIEETFRKLQTVSDQLSEVMKKINSGQGSLGMAVNDKKLYEELSNSLKGFNNLVTDLKAHPSRYINVTVFGRKSKIGD